MTTFNPDWYSPPGDTIRELLNALEESKVWLAKKLKRTPYFVDKLLIGQKPINEDVAEGLENAFMVSKNFWLRREEHYRRDRKRLSRIKPDEQILSCPANCIDDYKTYMINHKIKYRMIQDDQGKWEFVIPKRVRPHAWKMPFDNPERNRNDRTDVHGKVQQVQRGEDACDGETE